MGTVRKPTGEQAEILADAVTNPAEGRKIEAAAGSGKTTTLQMLAKQRTDPGQYIAFNSSIKMEAGRKFPGHIKVLTAHGLAYRAMRVDQFADRLKQRIFGDKVGDLVRLPRCRMPPDALGYVVLDTVSRFCNSADRQLGLAHVALDPREPEDVREAALHGARDLWARMSNRRDDCPITHDVYLKAWQLTDGPSLGTAEWAMFDEAQDASPVMLDVMLRQPVPVTWVGDDAQSIYAWRGAVNAMRAIGGRSFPLSTSFRFGQALADLANDVLASKPEGTRPDWRILGNPDVDTQIGILPKGIRHAFISRTNAEWFAEGLRSQGRVHVVGGLEETAKLLEGAWSLWRRNERAARVPSVARFATWRDLCDHAERFNDRDLAFARRIVEQHRDGLPGAIAGFRARHVEHEDDADLVVGTGHKLKGREFDHVRLGDGFAGPHDEDWKLLSPREREAELNLLYVAGTRAKLGLEPNQALLACRAAARGHLHQGEAPRPERLPEIRVAVPTHAALPTPAASTPHALQPQRDPFVPWTAQEDAEATSMAAQGFGTDEIAGWFGRNPAVVAVRLAVLRAAGSDPSLPAAVLAALVPVTAPIPLPAPVPVSHQVPETRAATMPATTDIVADATPRAPQKQAKAAWAGPRPGAQPRARAQRREATSSWGLTDEEREQGMQRLRAP
jgi:hypothetical protein